MPIDVFTEISIIVVVATATAAIMRIFRQPMIIGFILTGIIVGPISLDIMHHSVETVSVFSQMGVALLLFIVGLSMNPKVIREVGKASLITGLGQIVFTTLVGFFICLGLGFLSGFVAQGYDAVVISLYVAISLTFSSTIIIMKLLSDKHALQTLYGRISVGFLLVQDVVAIALLISIPYISSGVEVGAVGTGNVIWSIVLLGLVALASMYAIPRTCKFFAKGQEFLFLFSIAWGLGLASLFLQLGFSLEIGALIAGIALSSSPYHYEISSKMRPLRDFFIMIFFILLGSQIAIGSIGNLAVPIIVLSVFILVGNPIIVMTLMGMLGYDRKTGFSAGLTVAQISEFSLILVVLGVQHGHLPADILSLVTSIGLITIAGSTYMIYYSERIYQRLYKHLAIFERKKHKRPGPDEAERYEVILFGCNRVGHDFLKSFEKLGRKFLAVECDPEVLRDLTCRGFSSRYGDAADMEFLEELGLDEVKMVVSTIPDFETNLVLMERVRQKNQGAIVMAVAYSIEEAMRLYDGGASYVIMPHFLGGHHASKMAEAHGFDRNKFEKEKENHIKYLNERKTAGHEHPSSHDSRSQYRENHNHHN
ncbi:MAG: cation:proton antiporter [Candidatus Altiarchaeota archaeon]|nr:cation:proton antiporter [Candidatus Altiarchaeota archaeon]